MLLGFRVVVNFGLVIVSIDNQTKLLWYFTGYCFQLDLSIQALCLLMLLFAQLVTRVWVGIESLLDMIIYLK